MATKQYWIEEQEKELTQQVLQELDHYHQVQRALGLGSLKLKPRRAVLEIWAEYLDIETNRARQAFLGSGKGLSGWHQALQRVNHVKSFL